MSAADPAPPRATVAQPPLRGLATLAQVLLLVTVAADVRVLVAANDRRTLIDQVLSGVPGITSAAVGDSDQRVNVATNWSVLAFVVTAVGFVSWFWKARSIAGEYAPREQRRSQPWAFWGWVVPVVGFWFPFQTATDISRSVPDRPVRITRLLRAWWAAFVLAVVLNRAVALSDAQGIDAVRTQTLVVMLTAVVEIVAALLAIAVVEAITRGFDGYRRRLLPRLR